MSPAAAGKMAIFRTVTCCVEKSHVAEGRNRGSLVSVLVSFGVNIKVSIFLYFPFFAESRD